MYICENFHLYFGVFCKIFVGKLMKEKFKYFVAACFVILAITRKYPLRGYILGVLTHTTAWDRLWGGNVGLYVHGSAFPRPTLQHDS